MKTTLKSRKSRVLRRTTAFLVAFFLLCGAAIFVYYWHSQDRQMRRSIDETVQFEVENLTAAYDFYWGKIIEQVYRDLYSTYLAQDPDFTSKMAGLYVEYYREKKQTPDQEFFDKEFADIVKEGFLGMKYLFTLVMPSDIVSEPFVSSSSDESMVYSWEAPPSILQAIEEGTRARYLPGGVPELGMDADSLLYLRVEPFESLNSEYAIVLISDIHERVAAIGDFYRDERGHAILAFGIIMLVAMMLLSLISYFFLRYMIHKHITEPIDSLSTAAEEIMQGNLDVDIEVQKGEDFEGLKKAFREMMVALRDMIDRSTGGQA